MIEIIIVQSYLLIIAINLYYENELIANLRHRHLMDDDIT